MSSFFVGGRKLESYSKPTRKSAEVCDMQALIFKQAYDGDGVDGSNFGLIEVDPEQPYVQIPCDGGCVDGIFEVCEGHSFTCVTCRGTGRIWATLW